ncbi:hypothetical protein Nmel_003351, partial [Mimus melanotis]
CFCLLLQEGFLIAEPDVTAQMDQGEEQEYKALEETHMGEEQVMEGSLLAFISLQVVSWGPFQITWKAHICRTCWQWAPEEERSSLGTAMGVSVLTQGLSKVAVRRKRRLGYPVLSLGRRAAASRRTPGVEHCTICSECSKAFSWSSHLLKHRCVHTGLRLYA